MLRGVEEAVWYAKTFYGDGFKTAKTWLPATVPGMVFSPCVSRNDIYLANIGGLVRELATFGCSAFLSTVISDEGEIAMTRVQCGDGEVSVCDCGGHVTTCATFHKNEVIHSESETFEARARLAAIDVETQSDTSDSEGWLSESDLDSSVDLEQPTRKRSRSPSEVSTDGSTTSESAPHRVQTRSMTVGSRRLVAEQEAADRASQFVSDADLYPDLFD